MPRPPAFNIGAVVAAACAQPTAEERALHDTLDGTWHVTVDGPRLDLKRGETGIGLRGDFPTPGTTR